MIHGGVYPDLLADAAWWQTDDLWIYSFYALLIFIKPPPNGRGARSRRLLPRLPIVGSSGWSDRRLRPFYPPATKATTT